MRRIIAACLFVVVAQSGATGGEGDESSFDYDCGALALYNIARLENRNVSFDQIVHALPGSKPKGFSLLELREAGGKLGLSLAGIKFDEHRLPPGPWVVHLRMKEASHFVVARPIGKDNRVVQILDGLQPPRTAPIHDLISSADWTGRVLVVNRPQATFRIAISATLGLCALAWLINRSRLSSRRGVGRVGFVWE